ncbi:HPr family phosphocarrier protein [Petroclostridium sp. X23]|jgi:phosphocarrier protein HPr/phosphocarrier protein|uniref:HPr family phosphocarrier protein n=1 Tax=Petroclostridium sp. X23 TaxID=3045146 RepID=UPI0024ACBBA5|nr:HPr family phosphocarrier protein [Petroclostridium sp. X23]WHH57706.1 HPr family phosphocarrier protein [Petroclostridium sp. X23]
MFIKEVIIQNASGFHIRPAQLFVDKAAEFKSDIFVKGEDGVPIEAKSILGLMTMGLEKGAKITIEATGEDEQEAVSALVELVESKFGEE